MDMKEKKGRKVFLGIVIGLLVGGVTVFGILVVFIIYFFTGGPVQIRSQDAGCNGGYGIGRVRKRYLKASLCNMRQDRA